MDWIKKAEYLFKAPKPEHFTNFRHCEECEEHDRTLLQAEIETIGLNELGHPGWDPICFTHPEGKKYYLPAFVRLSIETMQNEFYFEQFLFHLEGDGLDNAFFKSCSIEQRKFIASFIAYIIEEHAELIEDSLCTDEALRSYEIWSDPSRNSDTT